MKIDYTINPILMGGLIKEVNESTVKVHLHGRLGVIEVPTCYILNEDITPEVGHDMQFYFSYIQVNEEPYDYDSSSLKREKDYYNSF